MLQWHWTRHGTTSPVLPQYTKSSCDIYFETSIFQVVREHPWFVALHAGTRLHFVSASLPLQQPTKRSRDLVNWSGDPQSTQIDSTVSPSLMHGLPIYSSSNMVELFIAWVLPHGLTEGTISPGHSHAFHDSKTLSRWIVCVLLHAFHRPSILFLCALPWFAKNNLHRRIALGFRFLLRHCVGRDPKGPETLLRVNSVSRTHCPLEDRLVAQESLLREE